jgi:PAS domain S-box-containing protein
MTPPTRSSGLKEQRTLQRLIVGGATVCAILLCAVAFLIGSAFPRFTQLNELRQQVYELTSNIAVNSEKLTAASRLYVLTGNADWIADYDALFAQLDSDIHTLQRLFDTSNMAAAVDALDRSNHILEESEKSAFALVKAGKQKAARSMVFSDAYQAQKDAFGAALAEVLSAARKELAGGAQTTRSGGEVLLGLLGSILVTIAALVGIIVFVVRRHIQEQQVSRRLAEEVGDRFDFALAAFGAGVCELSVPHRRFHASEGFARIVGEELTFDAMAARDFMIVHPDERAKMKAMIERCQTSGEMINIETRIRRPDGAVVWVDAKGQMRANGDGAARSFVCMLVDITERKKREAQL